MFLIHQSAVKSDADKLEQRIKELGDKTKDDMNAKLKNYEETSKKLEAEYKKELEKLKHELANEKTLQELSKTL